MKKQFLSILLAFCMIVALLPITAMAADDELVITGNAGGYTYSGGVVKIQSGGEYTITMADGVTETTDHIEVASDEAVTIILNGVKINANPRDTAMKLTGAGTVTLKLAGENMLQSDSRNAGIQQDNTTAELIITSCSGDGSTDGKLEAIAKDRGAGIGGGYSASAGKITINGGTITAISQGRGAGIGGGGGDLEAPAGGGSGGNVTINGGMVTANGGGYRGAGIGGGGCQLQNGGNGGSLTVNGGTVFALGNDVGGGYIAAPSANTSGRPSPTMAEHVEEDLTGRIDMILDGGPVSIGLESTILDMTVTPPMILRPGAITKEMLEACIGEVTVDKAVIKPNQRPKAPGMKYRHYAPKADLSIVEGEMSKVISKINELAAEQVKAGHKVGIIGTEESVANYICGDVKSIGTREDESTIAVHLFAILREFDADQVDYIYSESFDTEGIGSAIMNRLLKAAGHHVITV